MKQFSKQQIREKMDELEHWENYKPMNMASSMGRKAQINNLKATIREMVPMEAVKE
ncbi:hypothetical protein [Staphylococcus carnosus]|nr:hypothetical protein [Staphylococcus carnosus]QPT03182.1 hypothetical protein I6G40_08690 [Staphylococcus carnosus]UQA68185.1 hypothetical protein Sta3580_04720 [Staphylococcus carnosus]CAL26981.1 hypothetical protein SCA_0067 [Staphylococcus carnosus subsp. carnosus TM300]SUL91603.1 Uncharacterised protein [Staphylococcus carnosus]GEP77844.1 hypothetical protein SCA04_21580 [Staphylococcus carnosus]